MDPIISILIFVLVVAVIMWLIGYLPDANVRKIARVVVAIIAIIWLLRLLGVWGGRVVG